jgi:hypothetical protein
MPDLSDILLPGLLAHRLPELPAGEGFTYPKYEGGSIVNIPASICRLLEAPEIGVGPLDAQLLAPLGSGIRRVVLILMDALALHRLRRWISAGSVSIWGELAQAGVLAPITSIIPSTTSAALPSLWTGRPAVQHGLVGYELWLKEYGIVANAVSHAPITFKNDPGSLARAGFNASEYLPFTTLGTHLSSCGIKSFAFQPRSILDSGLSQMFLRDVTQKPFYTHTDLWVNLRLLLENTAHARSYIWVYWGELDHFSHFYGPDDERAQEEFVSFSAAFERLFWRRLSAQARQDTLVILTADHGQITTRPDPFYDLRNHPNLTRRMHILPTGENRIMYLFPRSGQAEAVREYLERTWPRQFCQLDPAFAVHAGLFGPGEPHPRLFDRTGDLIALPRGRAYLWWAEKENLLIGRHGGLSADEMLVPFLAARM